MAFDDIDLMRDELTDRPRAKLWAEYCRHAIGARSMYATEKHFEATAFGKDQNGHWFHKNKWSGFARGIRVPQRSLANDVDKILPGSAGLLHHAFWSICKLPDWRIVEEADHWLTQLLPSVRRHLFRSDTPEN